MRLTRREERKDLLDLQDYAQRGKIKFTVYGLQFKNIGIENQELRKANGLNYSKLRRSSVFTDIHGICRAMLCADSQHDVGLFF